MSGEDRWQEARLIMHAAGYREDRNLRTWFRHARRGLFVTMAIRGDGITFHYGPAMDDHVPLRVCDLPGALRAAERHHTARQTLDRRYRASMERRWSRAVAAEVTP